MQTLISQHNLCVLLMETTECENKGKTWPPKLLLCNVWIVCFQFTIAPITNKPNLRRAAKVLYMFIQLLSLHDKNTEREFQVKTPHSSASFNCSFLYTALLHEQLRMFAA